MQSYPPDGSFIIKAIKINTAGGSPAASHFFLRRQEKVTKKKATPVCRPCGVPSISHKQAGLRNSR
jgi:hypothetical protein